MLPGVKLRPLQSRIVRIAADPLAEETNADLGTNRIVVVLAALRVARGTAAGEKGPQRFLFRLRQVCLLRANHGGEDGN